RTVAPAAELPLRPFGEPEGAEPIAVTQLEPGEEHWTVTRDLVHYESALEVVTDLGVIRLAYIDLEVSRRAHARYSWTGNDFDSVKGEIRWSIGFRRGRWQAATVSRTVLTSTPSEFHLRAEMDAFEDEQRVASYNWNRTVPRDLVCVTRTARGPRRRIA